MLACRYQKNEEPHRMVALVNKAPKWNAQVICLVAWCIGSVTQHLGQRVL